MTEQEWRTLGDMKAVDITDVLLFDAPPDRWVLRGRWNGKRITGVTVRVVIDVSYWHWKPYFSRLSHYAAWLCVGINVDATYD